MKKLKWLWVRFWGKKYYIVYTDMLKKIHSVIDVLTI